MPTPTPVRATAYTLNRGDLIDGHDEVVEVISYGRRNITVKVRRPSGRTVKRAYPMAEYINYTRMVPTLEENTQSTRDSMNTTITSYIDNAWTRVKLERRRLAERLTSGLESESSWVGASRLADLMRAEAIWQQARELKVEIDNGKEPIVAWAAWRTAYMNRLMTGAYNSHDVIGASGELETQVRVAKANVLALAKGHKYLEEAIEAAEIEAAING